MALTVPTAANILALLNGNKSFFVPSDAADINMGLVADPKTGMTTMQVKYSDGFPSTPHLRNLLTGSYPGVSALTVPNPESMVPMPIPVTVASLKSAAPQTMAAIDLGTTSVIGQLIAGQDLLELSEWVDILSVKPNPANGNQPYMPASEATAVTALLSATQPDPNWQARIPANQLEINGYSTPDDDTLLSLINTTLGRS